MSVQAERASGEAAKARARQLLGEARRRTLDLLAPLPDEELLVQPAPIVSPPVWDLAHIGFFEELWLVRRLRGSEPLFPEHDSIYDAFAQPRASRAQLPLLPPPEAREYLDKVRTRVLAVLDETELDPDDRLLADAFVYGLIVQHELQHIETILGTLQLREDLAYPLPQTPSPSRETPPADEVLVEGGHFLMGGNDPWAYDNEKPLHILELAPFSLDVSPVSNGEFLNFVESGGYDDRACWTESGWLFREEEDWQAPQFWRYEAGCWKRVRFGHVEELPADEPVQHVSWFEADAYARWAGKRLPTEAEWEKAATWSPAGEKLLNPWGNDQWTAARANLGGGRFGPAPVGSYPEGESPWGCRQLLGEVWEWTSSDFHPYPGFEVFPYSEYSEVFFGQEYKVLRGGSWATDPLVGRSAFRNWDYPQRRQIFAGFRCARDA